MALSKSRRIQMIKDIASVMSDSSWPVIDLTLRQFDLPWSDSWSGSKEDYIIAMIESSDAETLIELCSHFGLQADEGRIDLAKKDSPYWQSGYLKVFISHISSGKKTAKDLKDALEAYNVSGFVAHDDIEPTTEWQIEIETALSSCELLVALIQPGFVESQWCDQEIGYALGRGIPVFTICLGADPHGFVGRFQGFNGRDQSPAEIAKIIFDASVSHKKLQDKMADIVVALFVNSGTFASSKRWVNYLNDIKVWKSNYSQRLEDALEDNSQISGSWGVPEQLKKVIKNRQTTF